MNRLIFTSLPVLLLSLAATARGQDRLVQHPFYPLKVGHQWTYRSGKELVVVLVEREVTLDFKRDEKAEKTEKAIGAQLKLTSGLRDVISEVAVLSDGVYRFREAGKGLKPPLRFFKFPLEPSKKEEWTVEGKTEDGKIVRGTFVSGTETLAVTINANGKVIEKLETVTITTKGFQVDDQDLFVKYWFARDLGVVRQQVRVGSKETTLELEQFKSAP